MDGVRDPRIERLLRKRVRSLLHGETVRLSAREPPPQALQDYAASMGYPVKLIAVGIGDTEWRVSLDRAHEQTLRILHWQHLRPPYHFDTREEAELFKEWIAMGEWVASASVQRDEAGSFVCIIIIDWMYID